MLSPSLAHSSAPGQKDTDVDLLTGSESTCSLIPSYRPHSIDLEIKERYIANSYLILESTSFFKQSQCNLSLYVVCIVHEQDSVTGTSQIKNGHLFAEDISGQTLPIHPWFFWVLVWLPFVLSFS